MIHGVHEPLLERGRVGFASETDRVRLAGLIDSDSVVAERDQQDIDDCFLPAIRLFELNAVAETRKTRPLETDRISRKATKPQSKTFLLSSRPPAALRGIIFPDYNNPTFRNQLRRSKPSC